MSWAYFASAVGQVGQGMSSSVKGCRHRGAIEPRAMVLGFRTDFFSMLRSWYNQRATSPVLRRLDLVLVTSTEPYQIIDNLNQSHFNVGRIVELGAGMVRRQGGTVVPRCRLYAEYFKGRLRG